MKPSEMCEHCGGEEITDDISNMYAQEEDGKATTNNTTFRKSAYKL